VQVGEDLRNHRGVDDRGDDLQASPTVWAVFDIDIEYPFEQPRPAHACRGQGGGALGVVIASRISVERRAWNDLGAEFGVGREQALQANQMQPGTRDQCRSSAA